MLKYFRIHGDNIVECERTFALIIKALGIENVRIEGPLDSATCPSFIIYSKNHGEFKFTFYPGFGRWDNDILGYIRELGGILREAADTIITKVIPGKSEEPILGIEYCGALPAGNQAWQRNGRAFSFARAHIPYLYIAELGGYELYENRERKASRLPNPAIPFSYLSYSESQSTTVLPVYLRNPGAGDDIERNFEDIFGEDDLIEFVGKVILNEPTNEVHDSLHDKTLDLVKILAANRRGNDSLSPDEWQEVEDFMQQGGSLTKYLSTKKRIEWKKTAYIASLTATAHNLMDIAPKYAMGITSSNLPICFIPMNSRKAFASEVYKIYPSLTGDFKAWLSDNNKDLAICWVAGFKPRGDDSRPDRGLAPLTRMLIGDTTDMLTFIYGPAKVATWRLLANSPDKLVNGNGLWEAVLGLSNAVLIDSATDTNITRKGYLESHWATAIPKTKAHDILVTPNPVKISENDVDTVIHTIFYHIASSNVFEGFCNPPGGDWSGISLLKPNRTKELRWLSLPRVSGEESKRPDHVLQIYGLDDVPIVLSIESKEQARDVEQDIGIRLKRYIAELLTTPASIERLINNGTWQHSSEYILPKQINLASGIAFFNTSKSNMISVANYAKCDIAMGIDFSNQSQRCKLTIYTLTDVGKKIEQYLKKVIGVSHPIFTIETV